MGTARTRRSQRLTVVIATVTAVAGLVAPPAWARPATPTAGASDWVTQRYGTATAARPSATVRPGGVGRGTVALGSSPQFLALDVATHTAYISSDQGVVSVVDVSNCTAQTRRCRAPIAQLQAPEFGGDLLVDDRTQTLYVASSAGVHAAISVFDVGRCRTGDTSGCGAAIATIPQTGVPIGIAEDLASGTLYVGNVRNHIDVIDVGQCHAGATSGCGSAVVGQFNGKGTIYPELDADHATLYVPENGSNGAGGGSDVAVYDTRSCRAGAVSGCGDPVVRMPSPRGSLAPSLNRTTGTLYVEATTPASSVAVLDVRHCTAADQSGCAQRPVTVPIPVNSGSGLAQYGKRLFAVDDETDLLSVIDTTHCHAVDTIGCPTNAPTMRTGQQPFWIAVDPTTATVYTVNHIDGTLGALNGASCSSVATFGCRQPAPTDTADERTLADPYTHTWYGRDNEGRLVLFDTRTCTATNAARCPSSEVRTNQLNNDDIPLIDVALHTIYIPVYDFDTGQTSLRVIDQNTCNIGNYSGCEHTLASIPASDSLVGELALDVGTQTLYATDFDGALSVFDAQRCNAVSRTDCSGAQGTVPLPPGAFQPVVDETDNTVFVSIYGFGGGGTQLSLVSTVHCRAGDFSGCDTAATTVPTGDTPAGMIYDYQRHTLYVLANGNGDIQAQILVLDTNACHAGHATGCTPRAAFDVGRAPFRIVADPARNRAYAIDFQHAAITVIDTANCNATRTVACVDSEIDVAPGPLTAVIDPSTNTLFLHNFVTGTTSDIDLRTTTKS